jgi:Arc/MetJ-type ribon-helix-helix transcriptional regulator
MSIDDVRKSKLGRPPVGSTPVTVRLPPAQLAALDDWIARFGGGVSRPEAMRQLVAQRLGE